jgi:SAM-dependent methyltransferase
MVSSPPEPFDRRRRRARRDRALSGFARHGFITHHIADELVARLEAIDRRLSRALVIGAIDDHLAGALRSRGMVVQIAESGFAAARATGGVQCDEDRLPFADGVFDLVISAGTLDSVNDLPGALVLARRVLKPDGLFMAGFLGAGSLPQLRAAMLQADFAGGGGVAARVHPQIDVRAAGDLLARAGFALPVSDGEALEARYGDLGGLLADLRFGAQGGVLAGARPALTRIQAAAAHGAFLTEADADGRVTETFEIIYLIGWAPDESQPKPARRGSAMTSLASALKPKT